MSTSTKQKVRMPDGSVKEITVRFGDDENETPTTDKPKLKDKPSE
jgi:hypothetical protein